MKTVTGTVVRGEYRFAVTVSGDGVGSGEVCSAGGALLLRTRPCAAHVEVWHQGRRIASGRLEGFAPEYLASLRYRMEYRRSKAKPVGRVGSVLIGPDAWEALQDAIASANRELLSMHESVSTG
jgi:hypothetical protein